MTKTDDSFEEKIKLLQLSFINDLPGRLDEINGYIELLANDHHDKPALESLTHKLHNLAGSGTTFGLPAVTELAREGENLLKVNAIIEHGIDTATATRITKILHELQTIKTEKISLPKIIKKTTTIKTTNDKNTDQKRTIYILESDMNRQEEIINQFLQYGYTTFVFNDIKQFTHAMEAETPDVSMIDLDFKTRSKSEINNFIKKSIQQGIFTIATCDSGNIQQRLFAARAEVHVFFVRPYVISDVIDRIDLSLSTKNADPFRVLIVDDSYELAKFYSITLENEGFNSNYITKPLNIMEAITHYQPELILLDLYMPDCTGFELASVIRQQENYIDVPIVFLSSETDTETQLTAMKQGADEFLTKPIKPEHLIMAVKTRIERYRQLKSLFIRDSLTGLHNHTSIKQHIETEILRAQRNHKQLCLVMIDVDHFKLVNDVHGHNVGDKILKGLARLMRQRLRKSDILGRYGGDEFIVILPETEINDAKLVIDKLRLDFENLQFKENKIDIKVTITCGIASYPPARDSEHLSVSADVALYDAKELGRNQVSIFDNF